MVSRLLSLCALPAAEPSVPRDAHDDRAGRLGVLQRGLAAAGVVRLPALLALLHGAGRVVARRAGRRARHRRCDGGADGAPAAAPHVADSVRRMVRRLGRRRDARVLAAGHGDGGAVGGAAGGRAGRRGLACRRRSWHPAVAAGHDLHRHRQQRRRHGQQPRDGTARHARDGHLRRVCQSHHESVHFVGHRLPAATVQPARRHHLRL
mmetsp:Transcript_15776/g.46621  ORF Transcript_15776/g.46621 Transcript_15776/m.46621 type:complete len:207 (+) Transcript_15776:464-1084(+)